MLECPRCLHALLNDPTTGLPPAQCPHCGQDAPRGPSLASLLRPGALAPVLTRTQVTQTLDYPAAPRATQDPPIVADSARVESPAVPEPEAAPIAPTSAVTVQPEIEVPADEPPLPDEDEFIVPPDDPNDPTLRADHEAFDDTPGVDAGPSFARVAPRAPQVRIPSWHWAALAVLTGVLIIQMLVADRARLAQDAAWRPLLERVCGALRCTLPAWQQPQAYTMLARDVKPLPDAAGVLQVRATFRNDARWPQPWPSVSLSLSDADGRIAGARVVVPADYLEPGQLQSTLAPGQSGQMTVRVREPEGGVVAFAFEFH
ncbi:Protein of unknown function [Pseudoxanthomonas sp. GM95]|uniref:DUF3426 domain-containing protein n=1 Tax=Pseudoxanthomonas sp. GM95 TaxID=1881043 RepID=UPI0008D674BE|nr:DUF3426 domain-containing protein [Pseudoxanthomonas sp. GM95]SEL49512.1 Protein of unknown function [Pseudoxanthomonas sp. GM95]